MHWMRVGMVWLLAAGSAWAQPDPFAAWNEATVYRDEWGVPHVFGDNPRALAFAFGYTQAEDHVEAMLLAYRVASGRAAEVLGEPYAKSDEYALRMGHAVLAQEALARVDSVTLDLCEGFAQGVNAWLVQHPDRVPPWADGVRPSDILALLHCYLMGMAPLDLPGAPRPAPGSFSGNAWAVAPSRSATGEALLAINPHMFFDGAFRWYEAHLVCQDLDVSGATLFGLPVILLGHNGALGWALTPNRPDFADVYTEQDLQIERDPKSINAPRIDPRVLMYTYVAANSRTYYVMTPNGLEPRQVPTIITARGPLIGEYRGRMCTYRVGGYGQFGALRQFVEMGRARDLASFQAALALQQVPSFHVVYADKAGNILYFYNAVVCDKPLTTLVEEGDDKTVDRPIDWSLPVPGDDPRYNWGPAIAPAALPGVVNPEAGYVQACGNPPWLATENARIDPGALPPWFVLDEDSYRARRARQLLRLGTRSFSDMQTMLYDTMVPFALDAVPALVDAAGRRTEFVSQAHPDLPAAIEMLRSWSYTADTHATGMTFFHAWWLVLQEAAGSRFRTPGLLMDAVRARVPELEEPSLAAAAEAVRRMRNEYQNVGVPWGDVHRVRRGDREEPLPGAPAGDPLFLTSDLRLDRGKWFANYGYGFAMVVRFGETPEAASMVPFGTSEVPDSPHFSDQLDLMLQQRFKPAYFDRDDVLLHARTAFGRSVRLRPPGLDGFLVVRTPVPVETGLDVAAEPPAPLPDGLGTFTVYTTLRELPEGTPFAVELDVRVPEEVCDPARRKELAVYACGKGAWERLGEQRFDASAGRFLARDDRTRTYAVLGPVGLRKTDDVPRVAVPAPASAEFESTGILKEARRSAVQETKPVVAEGVPGAGAAAAPPLLPAGAQAAEPAAVPPAEPAAVASAEPQKPAEPAAPMEPVAVASAEPPAKPAGPGTGKTVLRIDDRALDAAAAAPKAEATAEARPAAKASKSLADIKPLAFGPVGAGKEVALWTPDMKSSFLYTAKTTLEARLVELGESPAPLPEGMAVFSPYIGLERRPADVPGELALRLIVAEGVCAPEDLPRLRLYGYREDKGWYEAGGQKVAADERSVAALDRVGKGLHAYAVLGPIECRRKP